MTAGFLFGMVRLRAPLPKQLVVAACAVGLSFGTMFLIDSAPTLMAVALLGACTYAPLLIVANGVCERAVPDARLTEAITWLNAGYTCGAAFGPTVAGALIDTFGTMASFKVGTLLHAAYGHILLSRGESEHPSRLHGGGRARDVGGRSLGALQGYLTLAELDDNFPTDPVSKGE